MLEERHCERREQHEQVLCGRDGTGSPTCWDTRASLEREAGEAPTKKWDDSWARGWGRVLGKRMMRYGLHCKGHGSKPLAQKPWWPGPGGSDTGGGKRESEVGDGLAVGSRVKPRGLSPWANEVPVLLQHGRELHGRHARSAVSGALEQRQREARAQGRGQGWTGRFEGSQLIRGVLLGGWKDGQGREPSAGSRWFRWGPGRSPTLKNQSLRQSVFAQYGTLLAVN